MNATPETSLLHMIQRTQITS